MHKVFLFEFAACGAFPELEPSLSVEGIAMFKALLQGFEKAGKVSTFLDRRIPLFPQYPKVKNYRELFQTSLNDADYALCIAPESEGALCSFTKEIERSSAANLGSSSKAIKITSDKYETYKRLKFFFPRSEIFQGKTSLNFPLVAKPRSGTSGEGIFLVRDEKELEKIPKGYLLQEHVRGMPASASLLVGNETKILSINSQEIKNFRYRGARVPFELQLGAHDLELLHRAAEKIRGLFGYVGIDFIYGDGIKLIEINARPTTPVVAFDKVYGFNLAELILENYCREKIPEFRARRRVHIKKIKGRRKNGFVSFRSYSLILEEL